VGAAAGGVARDSARRLVVTLLVWRRARRVIGGSSGSSLDPWPLGRGGGRGSTATGAGRFVGRRAGRAGVRWGVIRLLQRCPDGTLAFGHMPSGAAQVEIGAPVPAREVVVAGEAFLAVLPAKLDSRHVVAVFRDEHGGIVRAPLPEHVSGRVLSRELFSTPTSRAARAASATGKRSRSARSRTFRSRAAGSPCAGYAAVSKAGSAARGVAGRIANVATHPSRTVRRGQVRSRCLTGRGRACR
jgi:hypothetical protein